MKSQLNKYRQYTISDFSLNTSIFKEYLQFCEKNNLIMEKKYIMENLIRTLKFKENLGNEKVLVELKNLCILVIIFSDFEIELLFNLEYFNPDIQKKIFLELENYLNNNDKENSDEMKEYINNKYNFWKLKLQNKYFISKSEVKDAILLETEVNESIEKLTNYLNSNKDNYKDKKKNEKLLILKIIYELSLYYFFKNDIENAYNFLNTLINYYNDYIQIYKIDNSKEHKLFYFDIDKVKYLNKYIQKNILQNNSKIINIMKETNKDLKNNEINNDFFIMDDITQYNNIINEDYQKYKNEIDKTNADYLGKLTLSNENSLNLCELNNKNCVNSLLDCLKIAEFLIDGILENFNFKKIGKNFVNSLKDKAELKIQNINKKEESDMQYVIKEITYYNYMLQLIESMINNEEKLSKTFLKDLSEYITNNTLTGNLKLSGIIHCNMINFSHNLKILKQYFNGFSRFFEEKTSVYKKETINQIEFITKVVNLLYIINEEKNKLNFPLDKEIKIIDIEEKLFLEFINIFIYWINCEDNTKEKEEDKKKEFKKMKKNLKYKPSINIIYILIESLKNLEFLKILKVLISNVLEFVIKRKHLNVTENNSELYDYLDETKHKIFNINTLLDGIIKNIKVIVDDHTYYVNFKVNFKESKNTEKCILKNDYLNFYIKVLFQLLKKIDEKIYKYESIQKINEINANDNIKDLNEKLSDIINEDNKENEYFEDIIDNKKYEFLFSFFNIIEVNSLKRDSEIKIAIINGINYFQIFLSNFKIEYMKNDLMTDISKIKKNYDNFKSLLNQDILYQLIFCLTNQKRFLEGLILIQYTKKFDDTLAYKLLQYACEKNDFINIESFKFIWKMVLFEYLSNFFYKNNNYDALEKIKSLIKRVSNHQFFKGHPLRKHFKIVNFINFFDYLNNIKYNF